MDAVGEKYIITMDSLVTGLQDDDSALPTASGTDAPPTTDLRMTTQPSDMDLETDDLPPSAPSGENSDQRITPSGLTLKPYVPGVSRAPSDTQDNRRRRPRRRTVFERGHTEPAQARPVPRDFKKFFLVKATNDGNLSRIDVIRANRELEERLGGKPAKVTETRTGTLILEVRNELQSRAAPTITSLAGIEVTVVEHERLNESKGTIWYANHYDYNDEQLLDELKQFGVKAIYRTRKRQNNVLVPTSIYILTFDTCILPEKISIGWTHCTVRTYVPRPRRCFKCQGFGHGAGSCRRETGLCVNCSEDVHELPCTRPPKCSNCHDSHPASSMNCSVYKMEEEILATQTRDRITYGEARRQVRGRFVRPRTTYAEITRLPQSQAPRTSQPSTSNNVATTRAPPREISTQTEQVEESIPVTTSEATSASAASKYRFKSVQPASTSCKPPTNAVVVNVPQRKRSQPGSPSSGSPDKEKNFKKPALPQTREEIPSRRHSVSDTKSRGANGRPTQEERDRDRDKDKDKNKDKDKDKGIKPHLTEYQRQLLKAYPVPDYAPTFLPPVVQTRTWDQSGRTQNKNKPAPSAASRKNSNTQLSTSEQSKPT